MWCWWPICYVRDMKFNLVPNSMNFFPTLNRSWGTYIGNQHHNTPECDVGDWYLMLVPNSRCWWRDLSPTSKFCHKHIRSPTSLTNINVTLGSPPWNIGHSQHLSTNTFIQMKELILFDYHIKQIINKLFTKYTNVHKWLDTLRLNETLTNNSMVFK